MDGQRAGHGPGGAFPGREVSAQLNLAGCVR
jgi:hypothetical protein